MSIVIPPSKDGKRLTLVEFLDLRAQSSTAAGRFARNIQTVGHFLKCCKPGSCIPVGNAELDLAVRAMDLVTQDLADMGGEYFLWRAHLQYSSGGFNEDQF